MNTVTVPALDHDAMMLRRFGCKVSPSGVVERRIVANLIAHLGKAGFSVHSVNDGEELTAVNDMKSAMELVFAVDEASLRFHKTGSKKSKTARGLNSDAWHGVLLIFGNGNNGLDCISDWNFYDGDRDGFDAAMNAFNPEAYA